MERPERVTGKVAPRGLESIDLRKLWLLGLAIEPDGTLAGPGLPRYSFWAECGCPDDCNRDHENE